MCAFIPTEVDAVHLPRATSVKPQLEKEVHPTSPAEQERISQLMREVSMGNGGAIGTELATLRVYVENGTRKASEQIEILSQSPDFSAQHREELATLMETVDSSYGSFREEKILAACEKAHGVLEGAAPTIAVDSLRAEIDKIRSLQRRLKAVTDANLFVADGLGRDRVFVQTAEQMQRSRIDRGLNPAHGSVAIIGGGPAGIRCSLGLGARGVDVTLFESGYLGQAFSDGRALPVHTMRTNVAASSLTRFSEPGLPELDASKMLDVMERQNLRLRAKIARAYVSERSGISFPSDLPPDHDRADGYSHPVSRGELFLYLSELAIQAAEFPSVTLLEQSPVTEVRRLPSGNFELETLDGKSLVVDELVVSCGFVGAYAEFSRQLPELLDLCELSPDDFVFLGSEHDFATKAEQVLENLSARKNGRTPPRQIITSDAMLGQPELQAELRRLAPGERTAVIGSGESAAKAALEILRQNPNARVDLFAKGKLEPSQFQFPIPATKGDFAARSAINQKYAQKTAELQGAAFEGTPITPATMLQILKLVESGKIRVFELGDYFCESTLDLKDNGNGLEIHIDAKNPAIRANLERQMREWRQNGLEIPNLITSGSNLLSEIHGPIVVASGYDKGRLNLQHPVLNSLHSQMLIDDNGRSLDPNISIIGAGTESFPSSTALAGIGTQAALNADRIAARLGNGESNTERALYRRYGRDDVFERELSARDFSSLVEALPLPADERDLITDAYWYAVEEERLSESRAQKEALAEVSPEVRLLVKRAYSLDQRVQEHEDAIFSDSDPSIFHPIYRAGRFVVDQVRDAWSWIKK